MLNSIDKESIGTFSRMTSAAERIVITAHIKPDGDAVGSAVALCSFLEANGLNATIVLPHAVQGNLRFISGRRILSGADDGEEAARAIAEADLIICLDFNSISRAGDLAGCILSNNCPKILIDHHLNPDRDQFDLCFSETEVSSTCELLYRILLATDKVGGDASALSAECAKALMCGMTTDTNNFANSVFPGTLDMASALIAAGVDRDEILSRLYNEFRENRVRIMGEMLRKMVVTEDGVAVMVLDGQTSREYDVMEGETEGLVNIPLSIGKVHLSIFAREDDGFFRVSVRSKRGWSANLMASGHFHGGGHEMAAGGRILIPEDIADASEALQHILDVAAQFMKGKQKYE